MFNLIDLGCEPAPIPITRPGDSTPKSYWILECERMETELVDLSNRLARGDNDVVAIYTSVGRLVSGLNRLSDSPWASDDPNNTKIVSDLIQFTNHFVNQIKQIITERNRWKPIAIPVEDHHLVPTKAVTYRIQQRMSSYLKEKLFQLREMAITRFSNLKGRYWPSRPPSDYKQMI
ncbi:hypothetical protein DAPPUDRAFT_307655 [Daphnia pulex]|uniref:Uncharacterized protein n=1 Tax=Daphnia pulex TaxID=6669 RepID=E9H3L5_DAPPU|nr:hypothetical protein DAPPUDRAFT_307655 [Daphnia pulex]|eukprot:EFX73676.1 hypothetical protein DAPPUDRAFT_307655 [Daphnia pulex]